MTPTQRSRAWLLQRGYFPFLVERWQPVYRKTEEGAALETFEGILEQPVPSRAPMVRVDLLGIGDLLGIRMPPFGPIGMILVQTTSDSNLSSRRNKSLAVTTRRPKAFDEEQVEVLTLELWLTSGAKFELHGWSGRDVRRERGIIFPADVHPIGGWTSRTPIAGNRFLAFQEIAS